jgi:eukaryotic-like serine/threonine-protein kinase
VEIKQDWEKIKNLFGVALERDPDERKGFLREACGSDTFLREEVESLLRAHDSSSGILEHPLNFPIIRSPESRSIGPYQLLEKIGEGGMGQVWLAEQTGQLQRRVALKLIRWGAYDDTLLQRFQAERQSLAVMDHPSIAKVFEAGTTPEGQPYFVMEYVPGVPITEYCDQKKLRIRDRLQLFITVCEAVQHAHQKAIIHRDLKPANILVTEVDGKPVPRIIDFGLAKAVNPVEGEDPLHTKIGSFVGTPGYMSPEQCDPCAQDIDTRTDVYSLGVILYVLLAGEPPFDAEDWKKKPVHEMLRLVREQDPPRPSTKVSTGGNSSSVAAQAGCAEPQQLINQLRGDLDWITMKAVEKDRARRYGTPSELADDLARYLRHEPVHARPASLVYRGKKYIRRHRLAVSAAAVLVMVLAAFAVMQAVQLRRITRERDRADRVAGFMTEIFNVANPGETVGNTVTAREILDKAAKNIQSELSGDPQLQAQMMETMGAAYQNLGLYARAQSLFEASVRVGSIAMGAQNPQTLRVQQRLAWTLVQEGRPAEAEAMERKVFEVRRRALGPDSDDTLSISSDLANTLDIEGNHAQAEQMQRHVLEVRTRALGPEHRSTLASMDTLAAILANESRVAEAHQLEVQAVSIQRRRFGDENLDTIHYMMNAASMEGSMGQSKEAEVSLRQVLKLQQRVLGPNQPETAVTVYNLASVVAKNGDTKQALSLLRESVDHGLLPRWAAGIGEDPDLNALHGVTGFADLVAYSKARAAAQNH